MTSRKSTKTSGEELGQRLLESARQMKARNFARVTTVPFGSHHFL